MKQKVLIHAGLITMMVAGAVTIVVFNSGEEAEHDVEKMAGTSEHYLHEHEETAEGAIIGTYGAAILSLIAFALSLKGHKTARVATIAATVGVLASSVAMVQVGDSGGKIRHPELIDDSAGNHSESEHEAEYDDD